MNKLKIKLIADLTGIKFSPIGILLEAEKYANIKLPGLHKTEEDIIAQNIEMCGIVQNTKNLKKLIHLNMSKRRQNVQSKQIHIKFE